MQSKSGIGGEIDWILATGLFILSIVFVFVLFRPGLTSVYDSRSLLTIVQEGFNNQTNWEINKLPVFMMPANDTYNSPPIRRVKLTTRTINPSDESSDASGEIRLRDLLDDVNKFSIEVYYLTRTDTENPNSLFPASFRADEDAIFMEDGVVPEGLELPEAAEERIEDILEAGREYSDRPGATRSGSLIYNITSDNVLIIPTRLESDAKTKYLIAISDRAINFDLDNLGSGTVLNGCSIVGSINIDDYPYSNPVAAICPVLYEFGAIEKVSGISLSSFLALNEVTIGSECIIGYDCVKEKWKFPATKEFQIEIKSLPLEGVTSEFILEFPEAISIPSNMDVFVRQFNDFVLTDDGTRIPVVVKISIW